MNAAFIVAPIFYALLLSFFRSNNTAKIVHIFCTQKKKYRKYVCYKTCLAKA